VRVLTTPNYVEGQCLAASMEFLRDAFHLKPRFEEPATLASAVKYLRSGGLRCLVRAKPLLRLRLRFKFWRNGVDVPVKGKPRLSADESVDDSARGPEASLHLIYCHYLYRLPPSEGWWHYVVELKRDGKAALFDSYLMRAKEDFGEACVADYPAASALASLSEVSVSICRGMRERN
jgi:hypothetical protein